MDKNIIKAENIIKYFFTHQNIVEALSCNKRVIKAVDDTSFEIKRGEILAIIGESGSGKTTIGKLIMKLINTTRGNIYFDGENIFYKDKKKLAEYRKKVQMIFQDPYASMNPRFKIKDVLKEPLYIHKIEGAKKDYDMMVIKALENVKIIPAKDFMERYPHMLSGGQRQRIATARALMLNPELIIADEPVSMIDLSTRAEILYMMKELQASMDLSYLYITHDLSTARYFSNRIAVMYLGKIVEIGEANEIIDNAKHPYTKALIAAVPEALPGMVDIIKDIPIKGEIPNASNIPLGCRFHTRCIYAREECSYIEPNFIDITSTHKAACLYLDNL